MSYNKEYAKEYYKKNRDKILENIKEYYKNNRDKKLAYWKKYQQENKKHIREYHIEYKKKRGEMKTCIIIPARMDSYRLPGKPLKLIAMHGDEYPMIKFTAVRSYLTTYPVYIATPDQEIFNVVKNSINYHMYANGASISPLLVEEGKTGTDRVYNASKMIPHYDIIVNVQGDCPLIDPKLIKACVKLLEDTDYDIVTAAAPIAKEDIPKHNIVKTYIHNDELIICSREHTIHKGTPYHHVGLYAYRAEALKKFCELPQSENELKEDLEQLRALDNNMTIGVVMTDEPTISVDTLEDLEKVRNYYVKK